MEVWLLYAGICALIYGGLLTGFHLLIEYQHRKDVLKEKWERFEIWKELETIQDQPTITFAELSKMYDDIFEED